MTEKRTISIQEYLSLGYIYLLILGIVTDAIYYSLFDINILNYSSILDVLLSPVSLLTSNLLMPAVFAVIVGFAYLYFKYVIPKLEKKKGLKKKPAGKEQFIPFLAIILLSMFLGIGLGMGGKRKQKLENGKLRMDHVIHFQNDKEVKAKVIGQNSSFIFYVPEGTKEVLIAPILSNISWIKKIPKD